MSLGVPLIEVNHMQAHLLVHFEKSIPDPAFPFLGLTVSGGHTQLVLVKSPFDMEVIGQTLDDAVGEAFDKAGKMIGLPYPAGHTSINMHKMECPTSRFPCQRFPV